MAKVTWNDFEKCVTNIKNDFEDLARVFFKVKFFGGDAIFSQSPNNAGIETTPTECNGKFISFQAKHFDNLVDYSQIEQSISAVVRHYNSTQLNIIYLFCNKDLTLNCESYLGIEKKVKDAGMTIIPICNNAILDEVSTNDVYENIRACFFGELKLNKEWFTEKLEISLKDLGGRYDKTFNVDVPLQRHFEFILETDRMIDIVNEAVENFRKESKRLSHKIDSGIRNTINSLANKLMVPHKADMRSVLEWYKLFTDISAQADKIKAGYDNFHDDKTDAKKREENREKYFAYSGVSRLIERLDPCYGLSKYANEDDVLAPVSVIENKIVFLKGDAGSGKSHLLGFITDKYKETNRIILLLGQKLISDSDPWTQIKQQLGITCDTQSFLNALECKGAIDNTVTTIMIDAINESVHKRVWKEYLNTLVEDISKLKHVKLVCSIRTTYIEAIFNEVIQERINNGEILVLQHRGFEENSIDAMSKFFSKYNIPMHYASYLPHEFSNPLLLKLFCNTYDNSMDISKLDYASMFERLIEKENSFIKSALNIDGKINIVKQIVDLIVQKIIDNGEGSISRQQLTNLSKEQEATLSKMMNGQVLNSFYSEHRNDEILYFRYEKMKDFLVAEKIITDMKEKLHEFIEERLPLHYQPGVKRDAQRGFIDKGVAGAIFSLLSSKGQSDLVKFFLDLDDTKYDGVFEMLDEMLSTFSFAKSENATVDEYSEILDSIFEKYPYIKLIETHYDVLITNAGKVNSPLNSNHLTERLKQMTIVERDYLWTLYINKQYDRGSRVFNTIEQILKNDNIDLNADEKALIAQLFCWLLTSSNRNLRDNASRGIVKLLTNDFTLIDKLCSMFVNVNDPYIVQRLFGCVYGAVVKSKRDIKAVGELATKIYKNIFDRKEVYPDILLRDYALNIIEYAVYIGVKTDFDIEKCRPPYNSKPIPEKIDKDKILADYKAGEREFGLFSIKSSLSPNAGSYHYGDFGRYTFQSAYRNFEGVDATHIFHYALDFIKNTIGYNTKFFNEFDRSVGHGRGRRNAQMERIGKKYQWITMYNFLARIADHHDYKKEEYTDVTFEKYRGTWHPYIRDFDPTLDLVNNDRIYDFDFSITQPRFSNWDLTDKNWVNRTDDGTYDFENIVEIEDSKGETWVALKCSISEKSSKDTDNPYQDVWKGIDAYLIKNEQFDFFAKHIVKQHFHGRWMPENREEYSVFSYEYFWSPAYYDVNSTTFEAVELDLGKKKKIKRTRYTLSSFFESLSTDELKKLIKVADREKVKSDIPSVPSVSKEDEYEEYEEEVAEKESIGEVLPCYHVYLWEEEFDFAKEDAVSINLPIGLIANSLNFEQSKNGVFAVGGEIVCADFSLVKGNADGLYIKKKVLEEFLQKNGYTLFWACMGEKTLLKCGGSVDKRYALSSFVYYGKNGKLKAVNKREKW